MKKKTTNSFLSKVLEVVHGLNERGIEFKINGLDLAEPQQPKYSHGHFVKQNWAKARAYAKTHNISVVKARSILAQQGKEKIVSNSVLTDDWKKARKLAKEHGLDIMNARRIVIYARKNKASKEEIAGLIRNARNVALAV